MLARSGSYDLLSHVWLQPLPPTVAAFSTYGCRRDALLVSQQHVGGAMKHALAAHRGDGAHESVRRGTERPLRPPEEVLWAEMVRYLLWLYLLWLLTEVLWAEMAFYAFPRSHSL